MQKKIIALAIASALTAPAAFAEVTVYGKADLAIGSTSNGSVSNTQVSSQVTKIGFKGSEDLGDGMSAIWQIEQQIDIDAAGAQNGATAAASSKNTLASRNSFLGLKSDSVGTVMLGRHDTPYKESTRSLDVFGDQFADNRHIMGGSVAPATPIAGAGMDQRPANEIMYVSPKMGGIKVSAAYALNTEAATAANTKGSLWALSGVYDQDALYATIAYQKITYSNAVGAAWAATAGDNMSGIRVGAGYTMDAFKITATYEKLKSSIAGLDTLGRKNFNLGGIYKFGNDDVKLSYTVGGNVGGVASTGAKMIGLGYDHNFSKTTSVYAQYVRLTSDAGAAYNFNNAATTATTTGALLGAKSTGLMFGMKHAF